MRRGRGSLGSGPLGLSRELSVAVSSLNLVALAQRAAIYAGLAPKQRNRSNEERRAKVGTNCEKHTLTT